MENTINIPLSRLELNNGQLDGLPKNPRFIRDENFERLKKSLQDIILARWEKLTGKKAELLKT